VTLAKRFISRLLQTSSRPSCDG